MSTREPRTITIIDIPVPDTFGRRFRSVLQDLAHGLVAWLMMTVALRFLSYVAATWFFGDDVASQAWFVSVVGAMPFAAGITLLVMW